MNSVQLNIGLLFHVCLCFSFPIKEVNNKALAELSTRGYEIELRQNRILFTAAYSIQFVRVNRDLFLVENSTCINMNTKETLVCRSYREDKNMQTLDVNLDGIVELKHVGLVYRLQHTFDEIRVYAYLLRPTNTSLAIEKIILKVTDEFQLRLQVQEGTGAFDEVPPNYLKPLGQRLLAAAEATAIRLKKPVLCAQKDFDQAPVLLGQRPNNCTHSTAPSLSSPSPRTALLNTHCHISYFFLSSLPYAHL